MRWRGGRRSGNIEDLRASGGGSGGGGGGLKLGVGGLVIVAAAYFLGVDPRLLMGLLDSGGGSAAAPTGETSQPTDEMGEFVSVVLADTEDSWNLIFSERGATYQTPRLVLFRGGVTTGCGSASSQAGPFYCPADARVYLDTDFFRELDARFGAPGDFAQAYVIAHEVGHHVQNLLGVAERVQTARQRGSERESNALQVRMELQADCYAGIWARTAQRSRNVIEPGDIDEALGAAAAVGDDMIQKATQGRVVEDSFTHGSAEQRQRWFRAGYERGTLEACDTFGARSL